MSDMFQQGPDLNRKETLEEIITRLCSKYGGLVDKGLCESIIQSAYREVDKLQVDENIIKESAKTGEDFRIDNLRYNNAYLKNLFIDLLLRAGFARYGESDKSEDLNGIYFNPRNIFYLQILLESGIVLFLPADRIVDLPDEEF